MNSANDTIHRSSFLPVGRQASFIIFPNAKYKNPTFAPLLATPNLKTG